MQELESVKVEKNLRRMRLAAGYSQSELSRLSGVNIRNIQLYEQGVQDINRASASTLASPAPSMTLWNEIMGDAAFNI